MPEPIWPEPLGKVFKFFWRPPEPIWPEPLGEEFRSLCLSQFGLSHWEKRSKFFGDHLSQFGLSHWEKVFLRIDLIHTGGKGPSIFLGSHLSQFGLTLGEETLNFLGSPTGVVSGRCDPSMSVSLIYMRERVDPLM